MDERADTTFVVVMDGDRDLARWRVEGLEPADLSVIDRLARLQLAARRVGLTIQVRHPCGMLGDLLDLVGLDRTLSALPATPPAPAAQGGGSISRPARGTSGGPWPGTAPDTGSGAGR